MPTFAYVRLEGLYILHKSVCKHFVVVDDNSGSGASR